MSISSMKKINSKLSLNKQTLASLDHSQMAAVKGGFTYLTSMGAKCRYSAKMTEANSCRC